MAKNLQSENWNFFWTLLGSRVSIQIIFFFKLILSCQQFDNCSHCLPPVSFTPVANLPPVSTTLGKLVANLIPVVHLDLRISPQIFEKIWNGLNGILWGWGGNWFMKKTRSKKSRDTVPIRNNNKKLVAAGPPLDRPAELGLHPEEQLQGARPAPTLHHHGGRTATRLALFNSSFYYILSATISFFSPVRFSHYNLISCP